MTGLKIECAACNDPFIRDEKVILVNNELYHKECVDVYPTGYIVYLDGECLGESENDDGTNAENYFSHLFNERW